MIHIDAANKQNLKMAGTMAELTAQCILAMRALYRKNLRLFTEPEIAKGILINMVLRAIEGE